ncbi:F-box only protein 28 isoform X2 [Eptesicus fuscus]|uniref:F-box only protein 28 isoform X2 n=1 Tax=Eptesicus fuscus TaxID=29078 RepID=UPI0024048E9C|nr:F-box only protein 28 isoform X2 [Eptesicus fuscus]
MAAAAEERMAEEGGGGYGDSGPSSAIGSTQRLPPPPAPQPPQPGSQAPPAPALAPDQLPQNNTLVALPIVAIENILSFMSYDEISQLRLVCKRMDLVCQRMLNQGFLKVERYHNLCQKQVKAQLPRRESERRNHSLARHADILAAVETRLSLLNMTFMKYVDSNLCCFIPGKGRSYIHPDSLAPAQCLVLTKCKYETQSILSRPKPSVPGGNIINGQYIS